MPDEFASGLLLAIEPDPRSGADLHRLLGEQTRGGVVVVRDVEAALRSIGERVPDLILTSPFLAPAALAMLIEALRRREDASHVQVLTTPLFPEMPASDPVEHDATRILRFDRTRFAAAALARKESGLRQQVQQYLELARALRAAAGERQAQGLRPAVSLAHVARPQQPWERSASAALVVATEQDVRAVTSALRPADRRRAARRRAADLGGQWGVRVDAVGDASIVDISRSGVRIETRAPLNPGGLIDLEVIGLEGSVNVGARLVRSEVVQSAGDEARYRSAAVFVREVDLFSAEFNPILAAAADACRPAMLGDLLGRVLATANWVANGAALRSAFEREVGALVGAKDVRIRAVPVRTSAGCQSLYFHIPAVSGVEHGLHIVFERGHRPRAAEFRLLKATAALAAVVLELAPLTE